MIFTTACSLLITATAFTFANTSDQLLEQYRIVRTSIQNQQGLASGDNAVISQLQEDLRLWNESHDDFKTIAAELQLSIWLSETQRCNSLFEKLAALQPNNSGIALAWSEFMLAQEGAVPEEVYSDLIEKFPNSPNVVLQWARYLDGKNQFTSAIDALEGLDEADLQEPDTATVYASLLFADNRFNDAIASLEQIDATILSSNPAIATRINSSLDQYKKSAALWETELSIRDLEDVSDTLPIARFITSKGPIDVTLFEDHAPNTVINFISLAESGYYDGTRFHRVLPKFMAQGGDPNSREGAEGTAGNGGPGYTIKDEHTLEDLRYHFAGTLSMAKTAAPNSGGSQFFLTQLPTPHLDGRHTVFGRITSGLEIARKLEQDDDIIAITIVRKRDHEYIPEKIGEKIAIEPVLEDKTKKAPPGIKPSLNSSSGN